MAEWNTPKTDWVTNPKNPVAEDFNRIEGNIAFLKQDIETKKGAIVAAINDMNQPAQVTDTHAQLASKIKDISKDATAAVGDVEKGKTFYAGGQKRTGTLELTGNATAADVLSGKTFYNTNLKSKVTGTMPNRGAVVITPGTSNKAIQAGYHNGSGYVKGDANLKAANIIEGVSIFGVAGSRPRVIEISDKMAIINSIGYDEGITALASDGTYLYVSGQTTGKVWKINPSDMSKVAESASYGNEIGALAFDGTYLYAGGSGSGTVWKINPSNMSKVAESATYGGTILALAFDGTYLYVGGGGSGKVWKINPSNMSKVAESDYYGQEIRALAFDGTYLYAGGLTETVWKINPSNMSKVAESVNYGDYIRALVSDSTYLYTGGDTGSVWQMLCTVYKKEV